MDRPIEPRLLVLRASEASGRRIRTVARWARALVPATALVVIAPSRDGRRDDANGSIVLDADEVSSGPLALADAIARAVGAGTRR